MSFAKKDGGRWPVTIGLREKVHERVGKMAKEAGMPVPRYVEGLFEAAYAARCRPTGDIALDEAVALAGIPPSADGTEALRAKLKELSDELAQRARADHKLEALSRAHAEEEAAHGRTRAALDRATARIESLEDEIAAAKRAMAEFDWKAAAPKADTDAAGMAEMQDLAAAATQEAARHLAHIGDLESAAVEAEATIGRHAGETEKWRTIALELERERDGLVDQVEQLRDDLAEARVPRPALSTDNLIEAIILGFGSGFDTATIAVRTGLSEATVHRIISAWREERRERRTA